MQIVSLDEMHEMSNALFWGKKKQKQKQEKNPINLSSAEFFQSAVSVKNEYMHTIFTLGILTEDWDAPSDWRPGGREFNPRRGRQHSFVEIDRDIFSTVILSLLLIQTGQLSVSGERMCTILVNHLED